MKCEICSHPVNFWAYIPGQGDDRREYTFYRCPSCRHLFTLPRPSTAELNAYYQNAAFYARAEEEAQRLEAEAADRAHRLWALRLRRRLEPRLLDVGCASGIFLEQAKKAGWDVEGVEPSEELAKKTAARGFAVRRTSIEHLKVCATYPLVTAWEVIEHVSDPCLAFGALASLVQPHGLLALSTPRSDGIPARLLGRRFPMLCPPEHLSIFSRRSLELLGNRHGLTLVAYRSFSHLGRENLARGFERYALAPLGIPERICGPAARALGAAAGFIPGIVDRAGFGSEMEIVFERVER